VCGLFAACGRSQGDISLGKNFALSIDGDRRPRARSTTALRRPGASAFTRKLDGASPCSLAEAENRPKLQPPVRLHVLRESDAGGRLLTRVDPTPCLSHATQLRTRHQSSHGPRYISNASTRTVLDRPGLSMSCVSCVTAAVGVDGGNRNVWDARGLLCGPFLAALEIALGRRMQVGGNRARSFYLHPTAAPNPSFRHQCVRNHNSASECADCLPRAGDLGEIQVWGRICIKHRRR
jgi:hypothetical protein